MSHEVNATQQDIHTAQVSVIEWLENYAKTSTQDGTDIAGDLKRITLRSVNAEAFIARSLARRLNAFEGPGLCISAELLPHLERGISRLSRMRHRGRWYALRLLMLEMWIIIHEQLP